jgi:hypothetical protein
MNPIQIDTTQAATDTIAYVATDQNGLTSTRTMIIKAAGAPSIVPRMMPRRPPRQAPNKLPTAPRHPPSSTR